MYEESHGYWNPVRQTAICEILDRDNKKFQIRALIDGGSDISIVTDYVLERTSGDWKKVYIPEVSIQGVNSCSKIRSTTELKIIPSRHLGEAYFKEHNLDQVNIKAVFHIMTMPELFINYRKEYPEELRKKLSDQYTLADPVLVQPGQERINVHAIFGVNVIRFLKEKSLTVLEPPGVEVRRSVLGDLISGNTHFVKYDDRNELIALSDQVTRLIL
jgi:hypothetical protein